MPYNNGQNNYNRYPPRGNSAPRNSTPRTGGNASNRNSVSTNGPVLFNAGAGKFLTINFWNRCASLEIGSVAPGTPMTWDVRQSAQKCSLVISFEALSELWDICEEVLDTLKNTGKFTSSGIRIEPKMDSIVEISNGENIGKAPGIYLVLYKNLDQNGRTNDVEFYPFVDSKILREYDHVSGSSKLDISHVGQFKKFYRTIKEGCKAFTMAYAHTVDLSGMPSKMQAIAQMNRIAASLGVNMDHAVDVAKSGGTSSNRVTGGYNSGSRPASNGGGYNRPSYNGGGANTNRATGGFNPRSSSYGGMNTGANMDDSIDINIPLNSLEGVPAGEFK